MSADAAAARDRRLLLAAAFLRALATGLMGVLLGLYLARLAFGPAEIGLVLGSGLGGAALAALVVTVAGDGLGRRRTLIALALVTGAAGFALLAVAPAPALALLAFFGMLNGMGRDRGAALILEQAMLPATTGAAARTQAFAWYTALQDVGHAVGGLLAALPVVLERLFGIGELAAFHWVIALYAVLMLAQALLYLPLSPAAEAAPAPPGPRLLPASRRVVWRISGLFAIDSVAGGFLGTALLSYFFFERFGVGTITVAVLFFLARAANAGSHFAAAWLARRIGLVNTMVFTHIPSSLALIAVALAPEFWIAAALFLVREALVEMDVPTRQSYVLAVVRPQERTYASGVTNLVRLGGWSVGPLVAGFLMQGVALATPLLVGAGMKIGYDLLLWRSFRGLKPPEER